MLENQELKEKVHNTENKMNSFIHEMGDILESHESFLIEGLS